MESASSGAAATEGLGSSFRFPIFNLNGLIHRALFAQGIISNYTLRLVFPTLQQNQSPLTIVPQFLDCLAKKMEHASKEQDCKHPNINDFNVS